mmetsp:Transcript_18719/g.38311  ORF Transcript_18719/g.38311 Transcript_18719/m.38311 type:complete len:220 (+) Transcript_18719:8456-9115(+)
MLLLHVASAPSQIRDPSSALVAVRLTRIIELGGGALTIPGHGFGVEVVSRELGRTLPSLGRPLLVDSCPRLRSTRPRPVEWVFKGRVHGRSDEQLLVRGHLLDLQRKSSGHHVVVHVPEEDGKVAVHRGQEHVVLSRGLRETTRRPLGNHHLLQGIETCASTVLSLALGNVLGDVLDVSEGVLEQPVPVVEGGVKVGLKRDSPDGNRAHGIPVEVAVKV